MELIDLTKILKFGDDVYSSLHGRLIPFRINEFSDKFPLVVRDYSFTKHGQLTHDGECLIFPSKDQRDWSKYVKDKEAEAKLEEAKLKYPTGTKVASVIYDIIQGTITGKFKLCSGGDIHAEIFDNNRKYDISLYQKHNDKWAEIIKTPLFITEDGVSVYGEELVWFIHIKDKHSMGPLKAKELTHQPHPDFRYFSTKESAEKYLGINKTKSSSFTTEQREEIIRLIKENK